MVKRRFGPEHVMAKLPQFEVHTKSQSAAAGVQRGQHHGWHVATGMVA
jgi:hypothetical protein